MEIIANNNIIPQIRGCTRHIYARLENMPMYVPENAENTDWTMCQVCVNLGCDKKLGLKLRRIYPSDVKDLDWEGGAFCDCKEEHEYAEYKWGCGCAVIPLDVYRRQNNGNDPRCTLCNFRMPFGTEICGACAHINNSCICNGKSILKNIGKDVLNE